MRICRFNQFIINLSFQNNNESNNSDNSNEKVKNLLFLWISIIFQIFNLEVKIEIFKDF